MSLDVLVRKCLAIFFLALKRIRIYGSQKSDQIRKTGFIYIAPPKALLTFFKTEFLITCGWITNKCTKWSFRLSNVEMKKYLESKTGCTNGFYNLYTYLNVIWASFYIDIVYLSTFICFFFTNFLYTFLEGKNIVFCA